MQVVERVPDVVLNDAVESLAASAQSPYRGLGDDAARRSLWADLVLDIEMLRLGLGPVARLEPVRRHFRWYATVLAGRGLDADAAAAVVQAAADVLAESVLSGSPVDAGARGQAKDALDASVERIVPSTGPRPRAGTGSCSTRVVPSTPTTTPGKAEPDPAQGSGTRRMLDNNYCRLTGPRLRSHPCTTRTSSPSASGSGA